MDNCKYKKGGIISVSFVDITEKKIKTPDPVWKKLGFKDNESFIKAHKIILL